MRTEKKKKEKGINLKWCVVAKGAELSSWPLSTTVQLLVRGGYLQNIHEVITT